MQLLFGLALVIMLVLTALLGWYQLKKQARELAALPQPRMLTTKQRELLLNILQEGPGETISITSMQGDAESIALAKEIKQLLTKGGWSTQEVNETAFTTNSNELIVNVNNTEKQSSAIDMLLRIFKTAGWPASVEIDRQEPKQPLNLTVGHQSGLSAPHLRKGLYL